MYKAKMNGGTIGSKSKKRYKWKIGNDVEEKKKGDLKHVSEEVLSKEEYYTTKMEPDTKKSDKKYKDTVKDIKSLSREEEDE